MNKIPKNPVIPVLLGELQRDGVTIKVWCPFCKRYHTHGFPEEERQMKYCHRVAHCDINTPFEKTGYYIQVKKVAFGL